MRRLVWLATALAIPACNLYFGGGGADDVCSPPATVEQRDPGTGDCYMQPNCGCGQTCPGPVFSGPVFYCQGACDNLDEAQCLASSSCHAQYNSSGPGPGAGTQPKFNACWNIAPQTPLGGSGTDCASLEPPDCAMHTDCATEIHLGSDGGIVGGACLPTNQCLALDCGANAYCQLTCTNGACQAECVMEQTCADTTCPAGQTCTEVCFPSGACTPECS
jgi:hypothetical protein